MEKKITISQTKKEIMDAYNELLQKMKGKTEEPKEIQKREIAEKTVKRFPDFQSIQSIKTLPV